MGIAQNAESIFWYQSSSSSSGDPFYDFLVAVYNSDNPPTSLSISWGADESKLNKANFINFNLYAIILGAIGVTIFAASGDTGVSGINCRATASSSSSGTASWWTGASWTGQGYFPDYPASSPYVVAVNILLLFIYF